MTSIYHRSHLPADIASFAGFALNHPPPLHLSYTSFYLFQKTIWNQPSTFTSPLLTHPKIILKVVQCTLYDLVWKSSQSLLNNSFGWRHLIFSETIWFHAVQLQFTQNHICRTSWTESPFDVAIDQWKIMRTQPIWWIQRALFWVRCGPVLASNSLIVSVL